MPRDPYDVIGVARTASAEDIKRAFRKKAKALHPDANPNDPKAQDRFAELNNAYELLSDEAKRQSFDRGEIDAEGKPRFSGFEGFGRSGGRSAGGGAGAETIFETFSFGQDGFRRSGGRRGAGGGASADDFFDILSGMTGRAGARGGDPFGGNPFGGGPEPTGGEDLTLTVKVPFLDAARGATQRVVLPSGEAVDIKIPAGTRDGHRMRLRGKGKAASLGRPAGDAYVVIAVEPHPHFRAEGRDIRLELPIALDEAILGGKVRAPTLDGEVELTLPPMTASGKSFRLRGKGLAGPDGPGDLYVTTKIVLPEPSADLEGFARVLKERRKTDPRQAM